VEIKKMTIYNDLAILENLEMEIQPVGIKYLTKPPEGLERLDKKMTLCEMLKEAQSGKAFFAGIDDHTCDAGTYILGQTELREPYINGEYGAGLGVFSDSRSARRLYHYIPRIGKNIVKYVALAPLNKLTFDPDVLIIFARTAQAEILLRAMSYKNGQMWSSRYSSAIGCAWMFVQPYLSGEINFGTTGLGFGMKRRKLFQEGMQWLSIPFLVLPSFLQALKEMPWVPPPYRPDGLEYVKKLRSDLGLD
jgi:uncharacterized protein (DUF169 family)